MRFMILTASKSTSHPSPGQKHATSLSLKAQRQLGAMFKKCVTSLGVLFMMCGSSQVAESSPTDAPVYRRGPSWPPHRPAPDQAN